MGGWGGVGVERKQLVKTELLLKGGRVWEACNGADKGEAFKYILKGIVQMRHEKRIGMCDVGPHCTV